MNDTSVNDTTTAASRPSLPTHDIDATLDAGLLVLRLGLAAALLHAAFLKLSDFSQTVAFMGDAGWRLPAFAAFMVTATETVSGIGLLLGLMTPLAAAAGLGAMLCAWAVNVSAAAVWEDPFNAPFLIGLGAATLLSTGAGAYALDARMLSRFRWSAQVKLGLLGLAVVTAVVTWLALYGVNPIHLGTP